MEERRWICPALLAAAVRNKARDTRKAARRIVKRSRELNDAAHVLMHELEVSLRAFREAAVREPPRSKDLIVRSQRALDRSGALLRHSRRRIVRDEA